MGSSRVALATLGNLLSCQSGLRPPFELQEAPRDFSQVAAGELGLILS